jgi:hypothetical protein
MHPELQRHLDGELSRDELPHELRAEADVWRELLAGVRITAGAPTELEHRVMLALPHRTAADWRDRLTALWQPRAVRVRPLPALLAAAAAAAALVLGPAAWRADPADGPVAAGVAAAEVVYVQFVLSAPHAQSVAVAGDFNGWAPSAHPLVQTAADGVWRGIVPIPAGVHKYMFVIDGAEWVTDPGAERYIDDGFGMRNALISVTRPARARSS